ncbi:tetratricopeptide repeat protein, partial [Planctomycetota bacterium]
GTARYMSPEQIHAKRAVVDHRADVYSLGITLYELATLHVAFDGEDRYELWRQISFETPTAPRKLDQCIPVDLETIILKSIEKAPSDRYETAGELAEDLRLFLENKPIKAKPPSPFASAAKWAQRHQSFVWLTMAVMATIIAILATSTFFISSAYQDVRAQRERAESHLQLARAVIDDTYNIELERLKHAPGMTQKQRESLIGLMKFYEQLPREELKDDSLCHDSVKARLRLGDIHLILGQYKESISVYRGAIDAAQPLCDRNDDPKYQASLVLAYSGLGQVQLAVGERDESIATHRTASNLIDKLMLAHPDDLTVQRLATEKIYLPISLEPTKIRTGTFRDVINSLNELASRYPKESQFPFAMAKAQDHLGLLLQSTGRIAEAESMFRSAVETQEKLAATHSEDPTFTFQHASVLSHLAVLLQHKGNASVAMESTQQAIALLQGLAEDFPHRVKYRTTLAQMRNNLGKLLYAARRPQEAAAEFEKAIAIMVPLAQSDPDTPAYRFRLATNLNNLGAVTSTVDEAKSLVHKQRAMSLWRTLAERYPDDAQYQLSIAVGYANSANTLDLDERIEAYKNATTIVDALAKKYPERIEYTQKSIRYKTLLGNELTRAKRLVEAETKFQEVIQLSESFSSRYPEFAREDQMAVNSATRAELTWRMGKTEETVMARQIAIDHYRLLLEQNPNNETYKSELCSQMKRLAYAHVKLGQFTIAMEHCHASIVLNQQLRDQNPDIAKYHHKLVRRYELLAIIHLKIADLEQAEESLQLKLDTARQLVKDFPDSLGMTRSIVETQVRLANVIIESDPSRFDESSRELEQAFSVATKANVPHLSMIVLLNHAMLLNDLEHSDQAREKLLKAARIAKTIEQHHASTDIKERAAIAHAQWQIGSEFTRAGDTKQASLILHKLTRESYADPILRQRQAWGIANWFAVAPNQLEFALALAKEGVEDEPKSGSRWLSRGFVQIRAGEYEHAVASLERAASFNAASTPNHLLLAIAYAHIGNKPLARQYYRQSKDVVLIADAFQLLELRRLRDEAKATIANVDH